MIFSIIILMCVSQLIPARETCSNKKCPPGTVCEQNTVICKKPPCNVPPPKCVPARTCCDIQCKPGYTCQMIVAPCLPDIQCPSPFPVCVPIDSNELK